MVVDGDMTSGGEHTTQCTDVCCRTVHLKPVIFCSPGSLPISSIAKNNEKEGKMLSSQRNQLFQKSDPIRSLLEFLTKKTSKVIFRVIQENKGRHLKGIQCKNFFCICTSFFYLFTQGNIFPMGL